MKRIIDKSWKKLFDKEESLTLLNDITRNLKGEDLLPKQGKIFNAFRHFPLDKLKVVILGQDPYSDTGVADGLAFSSGIPDYIPASLANIYYELELEYGELRTKASLDDWADQGVLLLNTVLTVSPGYANSHRNVGWQDLTDMVLKNLNEVEQPIVFLLWGNQARSKSALLDNPNHLVLESSHPSPLSAPRGFFKNDHFRATDEFLMSRRLEPINWINER